MIKKICITRDIEGIERVEKIVSLNPDKYEWRDFYEMLNDYSWYCVNCGRMDVIGFKTFKEWLDTEI
jgi:hypothetical protein